jgi:CheY-like chemotaxis protein
VADCLPRIRWPRGSGKTAELRPDVVLLDISMPRMNSMAAAEKIRQQCPSSKIIFLTAHSGAIAEVAREMGTNASPSVTPKPILSESLRPCSSGLKPRLGEVSAILLEAQRIQQPRNPDTLSWAKRNTAGLSIPRPLSV